MSPGTLPGPSPGTACKYIVDSDAAAMRQRRAWSSVRVAGLRGWSAGLVGGREPQNRVLTPQPGPGTAQRLQPGSEYFVFTSPRRSASAPLANLNPTAAAAVGALKCCYGSRPPRCADSSGRAGLRVQIMAIFGTCRGGKVVPRVAGLRESFAFSQSDSLDALLLGSRL